MSSCMRCQPRISSPTSGSSASMTGRPSTTVAWNCMSCRSVAPSSRGWVSGSRPGTWAPTKSHTVVSTTQAKAVTVRENCQVLMPSTRIHVRTPATRAVKGSLEELPTQGLVSLPSASPSSRKRRSVSPIRRLHGSQTAREPRLISRLLPGISWVTVGTRKDHGRRRQSDNQSPSSIMEKTAF